LICKSGESKDIADFLHCLSFLERKTAILYKKLSEKTTSLNFSDSFLKISQNAIKHSKELDEIATYFSGSKISKGECAKRLENICRSIDKLIKKLEKKNLLFFEELSDIIFVLESSLGQESFLLIQLKTLIALAPQIDQLYGVHLENFTNLLYSINEDEEERIELLKHIKEVIDKKTSKKEGNAPNVKYKNPDSWIISAP